jgi:hypothetical protein
MVAQYEHIDSKDIDELYRNPYSPLGLVGQRHVDKCPYILSAQAAGCLLEKVEMFRAACVDPLHHGAVQSVCNEW